MLALPEETQVNTLRSHPPQAQEDKQNDASFLNEGNLNYALRNN